MAAIRVNRPDAALVLRDFYNFAPNVDFLAGENGDGSVGVVWLSQTAMPAVQDIEAVTLQAAGAAVATRLAQAAKSQATLGIDNGDAVAGDKLERIVRAVAMAALDAINRDRTCFDDIRAAVAAATNLANLQTRFAAISYPPQVTGAQLVNAIKAKIAASAE